MVRLRRRGPRRSAPAPGSRASQAPTASTPQVPQAGGQVEGHLFVVTYGKSGSTLLMGLLDSLPGYCIRGENGGVLTDLYRYHATASTRRDQWAEAAPGPTHPWYGIDGYPSDAAYAAMRRLVDDTLLRPPPGTRVAGFKEIRWWMAPPEEFLSFVEALYPGARFVLNTRDHDSVLASGWWKRAENARESLEKVEGRLKEAVGNRGDRGYHLHYDDYVAEPARLADLCAWLGEDYDADRFAEVMSTRHTSGGGGRPTDAAAGRG